MTIRFFLVCIFVSTLCFSAFATPKVPSALPKDVKNRISIGEIQTTENGFRVATIYREGKMLAKTSVYRPGVTVDSDVLMYIGYIVASEDTLGAKESSITIMETSYKSNRRENGARYFSKNSTKLERRRLHKKDFQFQIVYKRCDCLTSVVEPSAEDNSIESDVLRTQVSQVVDAASLLKDAENGLFSMESYFADQSE